MSDRPNRVRSLLKHKQRQPAYQQLDIEPKPAGGSLLHDDNGMPKIGPKISLNDIPPSKDISNEPVKVKANNVRDSEHDGFYPPKSNFSIPQQNFVNVGGAEDHLWYDEKVSGSSDEMVDNNDDVDIDSLQGINPLSNLDDQRSNEAKSLFNSKLERVKAGINQKLSTIDTVDSFNDFKTNIFGNKGIISRIISRIISQYKKLTVHDMSLVSELISSFNDEIILLFESKENELLIQEDETKLEQTKTKELEEGCFLILIDDQPAEIVEKAKDASDLIFHYFAKNDISLERIKLMKRIPIDFGIILSD